MHQGKRLEPLRPKKGDRQPEERIQLEVGERALDIYAAGIERGGGECDKKIR